MKRLISLILLLTLLSTAQARVVIEKKNRLPNKSPGVCWWTCADMIGRHFNIPALFGLRDTVLKDGTGRDSGATRAAIEYWMKTKGLRPDYRYGPTKDIEFLKSRLAKGIPIIISIKHWEDGEAHAVLLVDISKEKGDYKSKGKVYHDYICEFLDPNKHESTYTCTLGFITHYWTGKAYAFNPPPAVMPKVPEDPPVVVIKAKKGPPSFMLISPDR